MKVGKCPTAMTQLPVIGPDTRQFVLVEALGVVWEDLSEERSCPAPSTPMPLSICTPYIPIALTAKLRSLELLVYFN